MMTVDINIELTKEVYHKIKTLTQEAEGEIAGILLSEFENDGTILIDDVIVLEQEAGTGSVDIDDKALSKFMKDAIKTNKEQITKMRGWWHSHANMDTFWSGTDENTIESFTKLAGLCISINTNKRNNFLVRLDIKKPHITIDKISHNIRIDDNEFDKIREWSKKEIKNKVKSYPQTYYNKTKQGTVIYYTNTQNYPLSVPSRVYWLDDDLYNAFMKALRKGKLPNMKARIKYARKLWEHQERRLKNKKTERLPDDYTLQEWKHEESDMMICDKYGY